MTRARKWIVNKYLPEAARQALEAECMRLARECDRLRGENDRLRAYIDGTAAALRRMPRFKIIEGVRDGGSD